MMNTPFIVPPVIDPPMLPAVDAQVGPDEMVIGISSDGESRAWLVSALSDMQSHVVVDTRGPQPIAVTFCDRTRCSRVLAGQPGTSLRVQTAGFMNGEMWLQIDGQMLPQSSKKNTTAGPRKRNDHLAGMEDSSSGDHSVSRAPC
jgi:hypothetical protein